MIPAREAIPTPRLRLEPLSAAHVAGTWEATEASLGELRPWLVWTRNSSLRDTALFAAHAEAEWAAGREFTFAIVEEDAVVGTCSIRVLRPLLGHGEIGYWVRSDRAGRGYATEAAHALVGLGFDGLSLERIELRAGVGNRASRRVASKLGFRREGLLRRGARGADDAYDCHIYGLLRTDSRAPDRPPAPVRVRPAVATDRDAVRALWRALEEAQGRFRLFPVAGDASERLERSFHRALSSEDERWVIAEDGGETVGMAHLEVVRPSKMSDEAVVELGRVVVAEAWRGRGVATAMLRAAEEFAAGRGVRVLEARVFAANEASLGFWDRSGFEAFLNTLVRRLR
jgi:RimJ/RimL family protein N-acetyltransferase